MLLKDQISQLNVQFAAQLPEMILNAFGRSIEDLASARIGEDALGIGDRAPDFALPDCEGREVKLSELLKRGPIVLSFQRGGWCPYCSLELRALNQLTVMHPDLNATIVGVTPELPMNAVKTRDRNQLSFDLLIDSENRLASAFGLTFVLQEELRPIYSQLNINLAELNGDLSYQLPIPATYVIGRDKIIRYAFTDSNYMNRAEPDEIAGVLRQLTCDFI